MAVITDQIATDLPQAGGRYVLFITHDERTNGQDILNEVVIDATAWAGPQLHYEVWLNGSVFMSSRLGIPAANPPQPCQPGGTLTWPNLNTRIDNRPISYSLGT